MNILPPLIIIKGLDKMNIPILYEKIYVRKKIDEYSLPKWTENTIYFFIILKFVLIYPLIGLLLNLIVGIGRFDSNIIVILSFIYISFEAKDFPIKNYLVYTLKQNIPIFIGVNIYRKVYLHTYIYFLLKYTYKYIMIFLPVFIGILSLEMFFVVILTAFFLTMSFMYFSSYSFLKRYVNHQAKVINTGITKFLINSSLLLFVLLIMLNRIIIDINFAWVSNLDYYVFSIVFLLLSFLLLILSERLHYFKVLKKLGSHETKNKGEVIKSYTNFSKQKYFVKDILLLKRTFNNKIGFTKALTIIYIVLLAIIPFILKNILSFNSDYIISSVILIFLAYSTILTDHLKRILSPDIEYFSLPNNVVEKIELNKLFSQKIIIYSLLSLYPAVLSFFTLITYNIDIIHTFSSVVLIIIIGINVGMASTIGAILYPKLNPESDFEMGNSQKANLFENVYLYFVSLMLSVILVRDLMSNIVYINLSLYMIILIVMQVVILLVAKYYLKNIKIKDVLRLGS